MDHEERRRRLAVDLLCTFVSAVREALSANDAPAVSRCADTEKMYATVQVGDVCFRGMVLISQMSLRVCLEVFVDGMKLHVAPYYLYQGMAQTRLFAAISSMYAYAQEIVARDKQAFERVAKRGTLPRADAPRPSMTYFNHGPTMVLADQPPLEYKAPHQGVDVRPVWYCLTLAEAAAHASRGERACVLRDLAADAALVYDDECAHDGRLVAEGDCFETLKQWTTRKSDELLQQARVEASNTLREWPSFEGMPLKLVVHTDKSRHGIFYVGWAR